MQTNWMYIVTETLPEGFWRAPQTYSDPLPYGDALALLVDLEEQTSRDDINFELVAVAQPPTPHKPMKNKPLYIIVGGPDNEVWTNPDTYSDELPYEQALELMQKLQTQALADGTGLAFEMLED